MAAAALISAGYTVLELLRNVVFSVVIVICVSVIHREGLAALLRKLVGAARLVPGVEEAIGWALKRQVRGFLRQVDPATFSVRAKKSPPAIPKKGEVSCINWAGLITAAPQSFHFIFSLQNNEFFFLSHTKKVLPHHQLPCLHQV